MFVELHLLQNFAPSNLNRDDTGSPKDCEFGGHRRARISSQCLKRAIRKDAGFDRFLAGRGGVRTRYLITEIGARIAGKRPAPDDVIKTVSSVFEEGGIERPKERGKSDERDETKLILFLSTPAIEHMVDLFRQRWANLDKGPKPVKEALRIELGEVLAASAKAPDIALFGRMVEIEQGKPWGKRQLGIDAACQVAHAISTNRVSMEFDFFTAVDDLTGTTDDTGAGMLGTVEFTSACFYRYANVDLGQLSRNLDGDEELARATVEAFLRASIAAIPTGKQNSMAAQNPPSLVFVVVRRAGLWSLANAFVKPVSPRGDRDLVQGSVAALDEYWRKLTRMYGEDGIAGAWVATLDDVDSAGLDALRPHRVPAVDTLVRNVVGALASGAAQAG